MIERPLNSQLKDLAIQHHRLRFWRALAWFWLAASLMGSSLIGLYWVTGFWVDWIFPALGGLSASAAFFAWLRHRKVDVDHHWISDQIEKQFPELQQLLVTAVEQCEKNQDKDFNYLQERVILEAIEHSKRRSWSLNVNKRLVMTHFAHLLTFSWLVLVLWGPTIAVPLSSISHIKVTPGDHEVERGTGMIITARVNGRMPAEMILTVVNSDDEREKIPMIRNLDDPIFAASIPSVKEDTVYYINYDGDRT
ncbi:MAG TPA: hypothetical protein EYG38_15250, partial [Verrucomicrobia bacterium]|nr:hypothetical protein [Verrucomicrobiota bacterium]